MPAALRIFHDRTEAGEELAAVLRQRPRPRALVLGIPRGGAEVAYRIAEALHAEFSLLVVRKLPYPDNPECGFGAIAEDGATYFVPGADQGLPRELVARIVREQGDEVRRRMAALREGLPLPPLQGRPVILVDDGVAMGSTTQAAVLCCRNLGAARVTVAAPVASRHACAALQSVADEVVILSLPPSFHAVAEAYRDWYDVPDEEVRAIMHQAAQARLLAACAADPPVSSIVPKTSCTALGRWRG